MFSDGPCLHNLVLFCAAPFMIEAQTLVLLDIMLLGKTVDTADQSPVCCPFAMFDESSSCKYTSTYLDYTFALPMGWTQRFYTWKGQGGKH